MTRLGEWTTSPPLDEPEDGFEVTTETCEIRPRVALRGGYWEAQPVEYRKDPRGIWDGPARLSAWARPTGTTNWTYCALTYHTTCHVQPERPGMHSYTRPRWRTAWVVYNAELVRPIEPRPAPTAYWAEQLSLHLGAFARWLGVEKPPGQQ